MYSFGVIQKYQDLMNSSNICDTVVPDPVPTINLAVSITTSLACCTNPIDCGTSDIIEYNRFPAANNTEHIIEAGLIVPK